MLLFRLGSGVRLVCRDGLLRGCDSVLRDRAQGVPELGTVRLFQRKAHELPEPPEGGFDVVVLNSVTEHFCSRKSDGLIRKIADVVSEGGSIFIGDNRSHTVLPLFHASVQLFKTAGTLSLPAFAVETQQALSEEEQMAIDPYYFAQLDGRRFRTVSVQLRRGKHHNEMTGYRFDATLVVGQKDAPAAAIPTRRWDQDQDSLAAVERLLRTRSPPRWHGRTCPTAECPALLSCCMR